MRNTPYKGYRGIRLPKDVQVQRVRQVLREELTQLQREAILAVYLEGKSLAQVARERGVAKSTVARTFHRAEDKLRRYLRY